MLLADDSASDRQIVRAQLTALGMRCTAAANGDEALQFLCKSIADGDRYAVALIDMEMPGMNGMELARAIKSDAITKNTNVILLCSDDSPLAPEACKNSEIDAFLAKPVTQPQLHQCLASLVGADQRFVRPLVLFLGLLPGLDLCLLLDLGLLACFPGQVALLVGLTPRLRCACCRRAWSRWAS